MAELGVTDRPGRVAMIHRVAGSDHRIGRFNSDIAAEIGHVAAIDTTARMIEFQRLIESDLGPGDGFDAPLFGLSVALEAWRGECLLDFDLARGGGEDDAIAGTPAGHL